MRFSIIIPFFGSATQDTQMSASLEKCVKSLNNGKYEDCEVIISTEGECLSSSRNAGIAKAKGDYLLFIDADDYVSDGLLAVLSRYIDKYPTTDIIEFPVIVHEGAKDEHLITFGEKQYTDLQNDYWLGCKAYEHTYACNKVFRRALFDTIRFPKGRKFEDVYTLPELLEQAKVLITIPEGLYHYVWNSNGICAHATGNDLLQLLQLHNDVITKWDLSIKENFETYFLHLINIQITVYRKTGKNIILPPYPIRHIQGNWKMRLKAATYRTFGIKTLCRLWKFL